MKNEFIVKDSRIINSIEYEGAEDKFHIYVGKTKDDFVDLDLAFSSPE